MEYIICIRTLRIHQILFCSCAGPNVALSCLGLHGVRVIWTFFRGHMGFFCMHRGLDAVSHHRIATVSLRRPGKGTHGLQLAMLIGWQPTLHRFTEAMLFFQIVLVNVLSAAWLHNA